METKFWIYHDDGIFINQTKWWKKLSNNFRKNFRPGNGGCLEYHNQFIAMLATHRANLDGEYVVFDDEVAAATFFFNVIGTDNKN